MRWREPPQNGYGTNLAVVSLTGEGQLLPLVARKVAFYLTLQATLRFSEGGLSPGCLASQALERCHL